MPRSLWKLYTGLGLTAGVAHFTVGDPEVRGVVYLGLALSGVAAVLVGVARNRPAHPAPWYLLGAGLATFLVGDLFFYFYKLVRHVDRPFPSAADALYLASYPLLIAGLLSLIRRRNPGGDRASLIDAAIVATALGLVAEVYLIAPYLVGTGIPWAERAISAAYPLADVALLAVTVRLALAGRRRRPADGLLGLAVVGLLAADTAYGAIQLTGSFPLGTLFDAGWMAFYLFSGAAALHPSMRTMSQPTATRQAAPDRRRLVVLSAVVLIAPAVLAVQALNGQSRDLPVIAAASVVLFLLVMARMGGLVASLEATANRERSLRSAAAALVAAPDRPGICAAAVAGARALVGDHPAVVRMGMWSAGEVAAAAGGGIDQEPAAVPAAGGSDAGGDEVSLGLAQFGALVEDPLGLGRPAVTTVVLPVVVQDEFQGAIVVASEESLPPGVLHGLDTLGSQVALALESAARAQDLHHRQGEARFASLVRNSSDVISVVDADSTVRYQTPSVRQVLGYDPDELLGIRLVGLVHPADRPRAVAFLDEAATRAGTGATVELRVGRADGSWVDAEAVANNLMGDPTVGGVVVTLRDVSERGEALRALAASEERFRRAFSDAGMGMALADPDGRLVDVNGALCRMLGREEGELLGQALADLVHPDDAGDDALSLCRLLAAPGGTVTAEKRYRRPDGRPVWATATASVVNGADGRPQLLIAQLQDITAQRELEAQVHQTQKMDALGQLAGGVAHDFNNLLTVIFGYLDILLDDGPDGAARDSLAQIQRAAGRAASLTDQLLLFSRRQVFEAELLDLDEVVESMLPMLGRLIGEHIELVVVPGAGPSLVEADACRLEQVVVNLVINGRDAMPGGGVVRLETGLLAAAPGRTGGPWVTLTVSDSGVGMDEATRAQLFEPFFTTKARGRGTGLGLSTVRGILEQSGGFITVDSAPGAGSAFTVHLPLSSRPAVEGGDDAPAGPARARSGTVLLVEDDGDVRGVAHRALTAAGYEVLDAASGDEGLAVASAYRGGLDLVVTDVLMPVLTGPEMVQRLGLLHPAAKVLFISGYPEDAIPALAAAGRGNELLPKPFRAGELVERVNHLLGRAVPAP